MGQIITLPMSPQDRLRLALRRLEAALDDQREAIAEFQLNLRALRGSVGGLSEAYGALGSRLGAVQASLATAGTRARDSERGAASPA